jgi:hypothetical protein
VVKLSYFSRLTDASTFIDLAEVEMRRRGVDIAKRACVTTDGADWCQTFADIHRSDAVRILDFPHASEHINVFLEALRKAGLRFPPKMFERTLHVLKHRGPSSLLRMADRLPDELAQQEEVRVQLNYLRKREAMMQYPQFQRDGWPIGSGMVESANKNVVETRLKGPGMHWERKNVNPMLALRNAVCNERWLEMWQKAYRQYDLQDALRRKTRAQQRAEARRTASQASQEPSPPQSPLSEQRPSQSVSQKTSLPIPQPAATLPGSSRPSPYHPWKRGPSCSPKTFAKI